jgi:hypothetical protein
MTVASPTIYTANKIINLHRGVAWTAPAGLWVGFYVSATTPAGGGTEVSGGSYARQSLTLAASSPDGMTVNTNEILTPVASATWGLVTHLAILDAVSGGNMLFHGPLLRSQQVNAGGRLKIVASGLSLIVPT